MKKMLIKKPVRLTGAVDNLKTPHSRIYGHVSPNLVGEINPALEGDISSLQGIINCNLKGNISGFRGEISKELTGEINPLCCGNISRLKGELSFFLYGDISGLTGTLNCHLQGDATGICGNLTNVIGNFDDCELSTAEREAEIHISALIKPEGAEDDQQP